MKTLVPVDVSCLKLNPIGIARHEYGYSVPCLCVAAAALAYFQQLVAYGFMQTSGLKPYQKVGSIQSTLLKVRSPSLRLNRGFHILQPSGIHPPRLASSSSAHSFANHNKRDSLS